MARKSSRRSGSIEEEITTTTSAEEKGLQKTESINQEFGEEDPKLSPTAVPTYDEQLEEISEQTRKSLEAELQQLEKAIKKDIPTKLEIQKGNAAFVQRLIKWERDNFHLVDRWRDVLLALGIKKRLDDLRPDGVEYTPNQQLKRKKA